jgi:hypothetical protein
MGEPFEIPSACPSLYCDVDGYMEFGACTPAEIQAALTNLGTCPAWQASGPSVHVTLRHHATQSAFEQTISALAGLNSRKLQLSLEPCAGLQVAADIVEHLGTSFGHRLRHLELSGCTILHSFWPAVWRHLPGLQALAISHHVSGAVSSADIAASCSHATRPLSLRLAPYLYSQVAPTEQLEQQCRTWGVPQVTVTQM